jgi:ADP-ribose pyrophosphatase YjhB (NUDIX family)
VEKLFERVFGRGDGGVARGSFLRFAVKKDMNYPLATVGALVINPAGQCLLIRSHKWHDTWAVPGGKIDYGETMTQALKREFLEETGLSLTRLFWAPVQEAVNSSEFYKPAHFILLNFIAHSEQVDVTLNDEAQAYAWLNLEDALTYDLNTPTRRLLEFYRDHRDALIPVVDMSADMDSSKVDRGDA